MLIGTFLAIYLGLDVVAFALVYLLPMQLTSFILGCLCMEILPTNEMDFKFWKPTIKQSFLTITSIFNVLVFRLDSVLLSIMSGMEAVGFYNAAFRLMEALYSFSSSIYHCHIPCFSILHSSSKKPLKTAYVKSFKYLTILSLPIAVGITLLAEPTNSTIIQDRIYALYINIANSCMGSSFIFINYIQGSLLTAMNRQVTFLKTLYPWF